MIRGPGSALYGADALHGVLSLNAFESDTDVNRISLEAANNGYYNTSLNSSQAMGKDWRINIATAVNGQPNQDIDYSYTDAASGLPATAQRENRYNSSTSVIKLASKPLGDVSYQLGLYYNDYNHNGFYHNGSDVPENDNSAVDSYLGMLRAEAEWKLQHGNSLALDAYYWKEGHLFSRALPASRTIDIRAYEHQSGKS